MVGALVSAWLGQVQHSYFWLVGGKGSGLSPQSLPSLVSGWSYNRTRDSGSESIDLTIRPLDSRPSSESHSRLSDQALRSIPHPIL